MKRLCILLAAVLLLSLPLSALGESVETETTLPNPNEEFVIGATTKLSGAFFTNMWGNNTSDIDVRSLIHGYSPVVWTSQLRFEQNPYVVQDMTIASLDDGSKLYMITLWGDLFYNDGTPITARDYAFSLMLFADPLMRGLGGITTNSSHIAGYDEYYRGETNVFSGIRLVDEYTFMIEIKAEYLPFFFEMAMVDCIPYPISVIAPGCEVADDGEGVYIRNADPNDTEPQWNADVLRETILDPETGYLSHPYVSSGPYMLTSFDWDTRVAKFNLNPHYKCYYDGQRPTIDNLVLKSVLPETMMEEYDNGEVQLLNKVVASENILEGAERVSAGTAVPNAYPRMGLGFINFSCESGPAQFESVRKAVAYAIDRTEYRTAYLGNNGMDVHGYYGIGQWMVQMILGSTEADFLETDEEQAEWNAMVETGLSGLTEYTQDLDMAKAILQADGWTLDESGHPYEEGSGATRHKLLEDGSLMELRLKFAQMQDSIAAQMLVDRLEAPLAALGMALDVTEVSFTELLEHYYRQTDRTYDMMYLATNFISIFDPYFVFNTRDAYQGPQNTTGLRDPQLEALALDMRTTPSGDVLEYCQKWVKFQEYFNEMLPMLPLYTNVYYDFNVPELMGYDPNAEMNWPVAILYATLGGNGEGSDVLLDGDEGGSEGEIGGFMIID